MNCLCGGEYKEVAFNCDLADGSELYDCICNKCGKHVITTIECEESKDDES